MYKTEEKGQLFTVNVQAIYSVIFKVECEVQFFITFFYFHFFSQF